MGASHTRLSLTSKEDATSVLSSSEYVVDQQLYPGSGRMMRTFRVQQHRHGSIRVAKTMWVSKDDQAILDEQERELKRIREALQDQRHVATFTEWHIGGEAQNPTRPLALIRNHVYTTLADRLESRPFLTHVEKLWIVYQLLKALQAMHDAGVVHGFLTTENIGLTSWNYVVILDIASYKAHVPLPDDDPSEYLYFFQEFHKQGTDTTPREKRCYLAPERFYSQQQHHQNQEQQQESINSTGPTSPSATPLSPAMDVFSAGCVLLETFLNGDERALDLGDLMEYRQRKVFPTSVQQKLQKIDSSSIRAACRHMLHLDPTERLQPKEYVEKLEPVLPKTFPLFEPIFDRMTCGVVTPDARVALAAAYYGRILEATTGIHDTDGIRTFGRILGGGLCALETDAGMKDTITTNTNTDSTSSFTGNNDDISSRLLSVPHQDKENISKLMAETEALLERLESLTFDDDDDAADGFGGDNSQRGPEAVKEAENANKSNDKAQPSPQDKASLLIFVQLIISSVRHVRRPSSKLASLRLLERLAVHSGDDTKLQRIVPTAISLLQDQDPSIRATAIQIIATTVSKIQRFSPSDSKVFPQYIFKRVAHLVSDASLVVRVAFAEAVPILAETAHRFLDISHAVRLYEAVGATGKPSETSGGTGGGTSASLASSLSSKESRGDAGVFGDDVSNLLASSSQETRTGTRKDGANKTSDTKTESTSDGVGTLVSSTYHSDLTALQETVSRWVVHMTTDQSEQSSPPKRALLRNLSRLCNFFGRDGVLAFILPQILAFLNDRRDWQLRAALFEDMPSVCYIIGRAASEHFVLPCLETALVDSEDRVLSKALRCLASLVDMGLLSRAVLVNTNATVPVQNGRTKAVTTDTIPTKQKDVKKG